MEYYFHTEGLTVGYDGKPLIRDIKFRLKRGEILTLIGPNGAGKTTILKSIIRQLSLIAGVVCLDGQDLAGMSRHELSTKLSVVLTDRLRTELMTCAEVVATGRYPYTGRFGILSENDRSVVHESMERVHILDLADRDFAQISDGQRQRVMLARALCQEPEILVLDEPTSFLDIRYKLEFLSTLQELTRSRDLTVILSLHELDLAARLSDQIACVHGETISHFGPPQEIFTDGRIRELYGMTAGTWNDLSGSAELPAPEGEPRVFVLGGCGSATPLYRCLQRKDVPFSTGILWKNDLDYPTAAALASEVFSLPPFAPMDPEQVRQAKDRIDRSDAVCCPKDLIKYREPTLQELEHYAEKKGTLRIL